MLLLVFGVLLWSAAHLFAARAVKQRASIIAKIGLKSYKGLFALTVLLSLVLIVLGWRSTPPTSIWLPAPHMRDVTVALMPFAVILFTSARAPTDIKQFIRHPQLTGVKLWAVAHLLTNGETRSLVLFGGMLAWAVLEVIFLNRRDGARVKPPRVGAMRTVTSALIGLLVTGVLVFAHPWFAGVPVMPLELH